MPSPPFTGYDSEAAVGLMNDLYRHELRLMMNLLQPSVKLKRKVRVGSRLTRVYDTPQTPLDRLRAGKDFNREEVNRLLQLRATTDPFQLAKTIERKLVPHRRPGPTPGRVRPGYIANGLTMTPRVTFSNGLTGIVRRWECGGGPGARSAPAINDP